MTLAAQSAQLNPDSDIYKAAVRCLEKRGLSGKEITDRELRTAIGNALVISSYLTGVLVFRGVIKPGLFDTVSEPVDDTLTHSAHDLAVELLKLGLVPEDYPTL
jgi:hypothetical protein